MSPPRANHTSSAPLRSTVGAFNMRHGNVDRQVHKKVDTQKSALELETPGGGGGGVRATFRPKRGVLGFFKIQFF